MILNKNEYKTNAETCANMSAKTVLTLTEKNTLELIKIKLKKTSALSVRDEIEKRKK